MNFAITQIEVSGHGWNNGLYYYAVTAKLDGKRETLLLTTFLNNGIDFHSRLNAFIDGKYDEEVFNALNAVAQERAEANAPQRWEG